MDEKEKKISFLTNVIILLGTIILGLSSYIVYLTYNGDSEPQVCEYNGWAYSEGDTFESTDGCNTCSCSNGQVVCTEMACVESDPGTCTVGEDCE